MKKIDNLFLFFRFSVLLLLFSYSAVLCVVLCFLLDLMNSFECVLHTCLCRVCDSNFDGSCWNCHSVVVIVFFLVPSIFPLVFIFSILFIFELKYFFFHSDCIALSFHSNVVNGVYFHAFV